MINPNFDNTTTAVATPHFTTSYSLGALSLFCPSIALRCLLQAHLWLVVCPSLQVLSSSASIGCESKAKVWCIFHKKFIISVCVCALLFHCIFNAS